MSIDNIKTCTGFSTISIKDLGLYYDKKGELKVKKKNFCGVIPGTGVYIKEIIYNSPATIVFWSDGTKTVSKCNTGDRYSRETGLAICCMKKIFGGTNTKKIFKYWLPSQFEIEGVGARKITLSDVMKREKEDKRK